MPAEQCFTIILFWTEFCFFFVFPELSGGCFIASWHDPYKTKTLARDRYKISTSLKKGNLWPFSLDPTSPSKVIKDQSSETLRAYFALHPSGLDLVILHVLVIQPVHKNFVWNTPKKEHMGHRPLPPFETIFLFWRCWTCWKVPNIESSTTDGFWKYTVPLKK